MFHLIELKCELLAPFFLRESDSVSRTTRAVCPLDAWPCAADHKNGVSNSPSFTAMQLSSFLQIKFNSKHDSQPV
jgi:hypothetical protein